MLNLNKTDSILIVVNFALIIVLEQTTIILMPLGGSFFTTYLSVVFNVLQCIQCIVYNVLQCIFLYNVLHRCIQSLKTNGIRLLNKLNETLLRNKIEFFT